MQFLNSKTSVCISTCIYTLPLTIDSVLGQVYNFVCGVCECGLLTCTATVVSVYTCIYVSLYTCICKCIYGYTTSYTVVYPAIRCGTPG